MHDKTRLEKPAHRQQQIARAVAKIRAEPDVSRNDFSVHFYR
jgi:hypothetical protein